MNAIKGMIKDRQILVPAPAEWPEGGEVVIELIPAEATQGMREEDWPTTPEGIAALLKRWDELQPLEMTSEEEARWEEIRRTEKEREKAQFYEHAEKLRRMWE